MKIKKSRDERDLRKLFCQPLMSENEICSVCDRELNYGHLIRQPTAATFSHWRRLI